MLNPCYKGLGVVIQFVGKERALQITSEYDRQFSLPLLISTYNFLNPSDIGVGASSFTSCSVQFTNLYDLMEINEKMASLVVKE
jgi:hypothetical protein